MGYDHGDLKDFLQTIAARVGVRDVLVRPDSHGLMAFVEVEGGFSQSAFAIRQQIYDEIEHHLADYQVADNLDFDFDYRVIPVGDDLSEPHLPIDVLPLRPKSTAVEA